MTEQYIVSDHLTWRPYYKWLIGIIDFKWLSLEPTSRTDHMQQEQQLQIIL